METPKSNRRKGLIGGDKSAVVAELPAACSNESLAVEFMERQRWGDCPCCPRCGDTNVRQMRDAKGNRNARFLWRCLGCKRQYTVRINSVYEDSRIPLRHWVFAFWSACAHKKGVSALQIKRQTGLNCRSALFMLNRIRHAMGHGTTPRPPMGGEVEMDEVYVGPYRRMKVRRGKEVEPDNKVPVLAAVQRGGEVRMMTVPHRVGFVNPMGESIRQFVAAHIARGATVNTDQLKTYRPVLRAAGVSHGIVRHGLGEYVSRDDRRVHTNTIEGVFSLLRRRLDGTHHGVSPEHLHRYCAEAEYVYSTRHMDDGERTVTAIRKASGKRLTYAQSVLCGRVG